MLILSSFLTDLIKGITSMNSIASVAVGVVVTTKEKKLLTLEEKSEIIERHSNYQSGQSGRTLLVCIEVLSFVNLLK